MEGGVIGNLGTIPGAAIKPVRERYPQLRVEKGEVYFFNKNTGEIKKAKKGEAYFIGKERNHENPVTIGRKSADTIGKKDVLLAEKYRYASRNHSEIFFSSDENAYFLVDYSLNGTLINGSKIGGDRVSERRKLKHKDSIEIPALGDKVKLIFLTHKVSLMEWWKLS